MDVELVSAGARYVLRTMVDNTSKTCLDFGCEHVIHQRLDAFFSTAVYLQSVVCRLSKILWRTILGDGFGLAGE